MNHWAAFFGPAGYLGLFDPGRAHDVGRLYRTSDPAEAERWRETLLTGERPETKLEHVALSRLGLKHVRANPEDLAVFTDFRKFLDHWDFLDQERKTHRLLGPSLWPAQLEFVRVAQEHPWIYVLKARKLGETTIATAFDAFVLRGQPNSRVHLFSWRQDAANQIHDALRDGLRKLPTWMRLPLESTTTEVRLDAGPDDRRVAVAYPANESTSAEASCTHCHLDEWSRMARPAAIFTAVEPTLAGSAHIVSTGMGPANPASIFYRRSMSGDTAFHPCFIGALERPDRNDAWLAGKRRELDATSFQREYAMSVEDALAGSGEYAFSGHDIDAAGRDFYPLRPAQPRHRYVKGWDIGQVDATVGVVLDITSQPYDVAHFVRVVGATYPQIQNMIESTNRAYPGPTAIEKNSMGAAVMENLNISEHMLLGFTTSKASKAQGLQELALHLQNQTLKWDPTSCARLDQEMRSYQYDDRYLVQDCVMALLVAVWAAAQNPEGRVLAIMKV